MKRILPAILVAVLLLSVAAAVPVYAVEPGPPNLQKKVFIHFEKPGKGKGPPSDRGGEDDGSYKLIRGGVHWQSFPVPLEVNPSLSSLDPNIVVDVIGLSAEEWDDGAYSGWGGVTPDLFGEITTTTKGYGDLAWTSDGLDGANTLVWGDYPTEGVIAVTLLWFNVKTKAIVEFDIVFDVDYAWSVTGEPNKMDLQNIATHELGHGAGLDDLSQDKAAEETMYAYSALGETKKRDLYLGDQEGIVKLYG